MTLKEELEQRARARAKAERLRIVKLAGEQRYLARSRTVEPGAYFELTVSPWGHVRCSCPGFSYRSVCKHAAALHERLEEGRNRAQLQNEAEDDAAALFRRMARNARAAEGKWR